MAPTDQELMEEYRSKLRAANVLESKDPTYTLQKLHECINLLKSLNNPTKNSNLDKKILERRISKLEANTVIRDLDNVSEPELETVDDSVFEEGTYVNEDLAENQSIDNNASENMEQVETAISTDAIPTHSVSDTETSDFTSLGIYRTPYKMEVPELLPDIFQEVYEALLAGTTLEYQAYLTFYESINDLYPDPFPPIVFQKSEVAFYVGDTHGAFKETQIMIRYFQRVLEHRKSKEIKIIFLGDYVDRNPNDLENLTLILAFWQKYPDNVIVLRGNHEDSKINQYYGFLQNLVDTFVIEDWVKSLYQEILDVFTKLSVAHIDALFSKAGDQEIRVFSAHGGIPIDTDNPSQPVNLTNLPELIHSNIPTFEQFDKYMNWLLWADPREEVEDIVLRPDIGRNQFGIGPFNRFMETNGLHFMVRAHEVLKEGYKYFFNERLISLFSASTYKNRPIGKAAFLRLEASKSPKILSTDPDMLEMDFDFWQQSLLSLEE